MNTNIHVNVNEIPPEVAERIGCVFLGFHKRFQQSCVYLNLILVQLLDIIERDRKE